MPQISINPDFFDELDNTLTLPDVVFDHSVQLDAFAGSQSAGDPEALQLSSTLIRFAEQRAEDGRPGTVTYDYRLSGRGLDPVSSIEELWEAINNGLADGTLGTLQVRRAGVLFLELRVTEDAYILASGAQSLTLRGDLALTLGDIGELGDIAERLSRIEDLTVSQRRALFNDLSDYGVTGLTIADGNTAYLDIDISAETASFTLNGLTVTLFGTFPLDFGATAEAAWQISRQLAANGTVDWDSVDGLALDSLRVTGADGAVLMRITDVTDGLDARVLVGGRPINEVLTGTLGDDWNLDGAVGARVNSVLVGLAGNDVLRGNAGNDQLFGGRDNDILDGGTGNDSLYGGEGFDTARFLSPEDITVDLRLTSSQSTGMGQDLLIGIEDVESGDGDDRLTGNNSGNRLIAGEGNDLLRGLGGIDLLRGDAGNDTLIGGDGFDYAEFDRFAGGEGITVNLGLSRAQQTGDGRDRLVDIEGVVVLGLSDDSLVGNNLANFLVADQGDDFLSGNGGRDTLDGGRGNDTLIGGAGEDTFVFILDSYNERGRDRVADFNSAADTIRLVVAPWSSLAGLTADEIVDTFASVQAGRVVFDLGIGSFTLSGVGSTTGLADRIEIIVPDFDF